MNAPPRRRLLDAIGSSPTFVAEGCQLTGDVQTRGPLVVSGSIRGDGHIAGTLSMAAKSRWEGDVRAKQAVIAGEVVGRLIIEEKLEIGASAVIRGQVAARSIAIAKGAVIEGEVSVAGGDAPVSFEEKRV
ncbi:MAG TPA: polymer-forming cytoskeletal protein [Steroidobacteraceae bacterium]|nr:polymer-forming cytoskeletal protein [Steroidobacteraceae bacterium]